MTDYNTLAMRIGILDIQGSVREHRQKLLKLGVNPVMVKLPVDFEGLDGLIIPGGESTTIGLLISKFGLAEVLKRKINEGMAVWGTCAGAILLAKLGLMDIEVERNAYGRQLYSFETEVEFEREKIPAVFIRAPKINSASSNVKILSEYEDSKIALRQGKILATSFHPELTDDKTVHRYFLKMCQAAI